MASERAGELIAQVAERLLADGDALAREMDAVIFEASPVLAADATIAGETAASNQANLVRWLTAMVRHPGEPVSGDVPPQALDIARSVVRRGIELESLMTAYRRGQNLAWARWMEIAAELVIDRDELIEVLDTSSALMFSYTDRMLDGVLAHAQHEREELLGGALARRTETVRLILDGAPIDSERASARIGYDLGRLHTAVVIWAEPAGTVQGALERAAATLARAAGTTRPLTLPAGTSTLWGWIATDHEPDTAALIEAMDGAEPNIRAAVGPAGSGITGFRRSHVAALAAHALLAGQAGERLTTYRELEVVALADQDAERAAEFVASTLGPLAAQDAAAERSRETLRIYLDEGGNAPRSARRLNTHRNTILHRVARAEELLGHRVSDRRLELSLALELAHRLGPRVLR